MNEHQEVIKGFEDAGVLDGIRWAYQSATSRVLADYSEAAGHDSAWVGTSRFVLFRDRLDRVFSCGRYSVGTDSSVLASLDLLNAELTSVDVSTMPQLPSGLVVRANLNGSPGWVWQGWRWLLASSAVGKIDRLPWPQKSPTKQKVAQQTDVNPAQASLFDGDLGEEEIAGLLALRESQKLDLETLVLAHAQDADHDARELVLGRPQMNFGGGSAWNWRENLFTARAPEGGHRSAYSRSLIDPDTIADAPVRLRREPKEQRSDQAGE